jgi:putative ABC transport system permease protein
VIVSVFGGLIGIVAGKFFTDGIAMLTRNPAAITPATAMTAVIFAAGTGLVFGMYPAIEASRLNPIDALRVE